MELMAKESTDPPAVAIKPAIASGVVVKFNQARRKLRGAQKEFRGQRKMKRDFFEHDTRSFKTLNGKWATKEGKTFDPSNGVLKQETSPKEPDKAIAGVAMNSKARRAAKYREMKLLQKIMLSKDMDFSLANLKPLTGSSCCCHCTCKSQTVTETQSGGELVHTSEFCNRETIETCVVR